MTEQITLLLERWSQGDRSAMDELMPAVYEELRKLGRSYLQKRPDQLILQPTMLVHEAWMKISEKQNLSVHSRAQFYALSAKIMRDILVDHVRRQRAAKRGGHQIATDFSDVSSPKVQPPVVDLLALNDALDRLERINPRCVQIVEMKFFGGLTIAESIEVLHTSHATLEREWNFARAWLRRELGSLQAEL